MDAILVCVDGSGDWSDEDYAAFFDNSLVNTIFKQTTATHRWYVRGPSSDGEATDDKARAGLAFIKRVLDSRREYRKPVSVSISMPGDRPALQVVGVTDAWPWAAVEAEMAKPIVWPISTGPSAVPTYLKGF